MTLNVLSDIVTDLSYITYKCTTLYVYQRGIKKPTKNKQKTVKNNYTRVFKENTQDMKFRTRYFFF